MTLRLTIAENAHSNGVKHIQGEVYQLQLLCPVLLAKSSVQMFRFSVMALGRRWPCGIYMGEQGTVLIKRTADGGLLRSNLDPDDVNVNRRRFHLTSHLMH